MKLNGIVHKIATSGEYTEVTLELPEYTKLLGIRNRKVTIPYEENPGWSEGEEVTINIGLNSQ